MQLVWVNTGVLGGISAVDGVKNAVLRAYALEIMVAVLLVWYLLSVLGAKVRHFEGIVLIVSLSSDGFGGVEIEDVMIGTFLSMDLALFLECILSYRDT